MAALPSFDFAEVLKDAPAGEWIALSHDRKRIVSSAKTLDEAVRLARAAGEPQPIVFKIPPVGALIL